MSPSFFDSNVVLYLLSGDAAKADRAEALLEAGGVISVQVLNEVASVCRRKLKMPWTEIDALLLAVKTACEVVPLTVASHEKAVEVAKRLQLSMYDAHIVASVEGSLARLGVDHLDILLLHRPDPLVEPDEVARAFDALHASGKVRHFGVSNHTRGQIDLLRRHVRQPLVANQVEISLLHLPLIDDGVVANTTGHAYASARGTLDHARLHGIRLQAWSPLAGGKLAMASGFADPVIRETATLLRQLAEAHRVTPEAIQLAWLLRHPAGLQPIVGTTDPVRLAACCAADEVQLSREEWYALFTAARGGRVP